MARDLAIGKVLELLRLSKSVDRNSLANILQVDRSGISKKEADNSNPRWSSIVAHKEAVGASWIEFARALLLLSDETATDDLANLTSGVNSASTSTRRSVDTKSSLREALDSFVEEIEMRTLGNRLTFEAAEQLREEMAAIRHRINQLETGERNVADLIPTEKPVE
jgi:transcriptional regulator with XRE-family HTH domain